MSFVENILMYPFITQPLSEGKTKDGKTIKIQEAWAVKCQDGGEKSGKLTNSGKLTKKKKSRFQVISSLQSKYQIKQFLKFHRKKLTKDFQAGYSWLIVH